MFKAEGEKRYARAGGICERCKARPATQRHHVMRRSNRVDHSEANLRVLCDDCHAHVHAEVAESKRLGWIVHENPQIELRLTE